MNILDLIIAIILLLGAIRGFQKGFFHEAATLVALIAGIFIALLAARIAGSIIEGLTNWNIQLVMVVVFIVAFLIVAGLIKLLGSLLTRLLKTLMLGLINRVAGLAFGILKWSLILAVIFSLITFFDEGRNLLSEDLLSGSILYTQLEKLNILHFIMKQLPENNIIHSIT